jgi:hypothetical protein
MPSLAATGAKMGTKTITPGKGSMKMPNSSKNTLRTIKNPHTLRSKLLIQLAINCGTPSMVSTQAKEADMPMMISTDAVSKADRHKMSGIMAHVNVL